MCIRELHFCQQQLSKKGDKMMKMWLHTSNRQRSSLLMDIILEAYNTSKALEYATDGFIFILENL